MSEPIQTDAPEIDPQLVEALGFSLLYTRNAGQNDDPALAEELSREAWQDSPEVRKGYRAQARFLIAELLDSAGCRLRSSDGKRLAQRLTWMQTIPPRQAYSADELR